MNDNATEMTVLPRDKRKIVGAALLALVFAAVVLVAFILPAEFNRDPLGLGAAMGIAGLSKPAAESAVTVRLEEAGFHQDSVEFELLPFEFVEYKYQLSKGSSLLYSWTTSKTRGGEASPVAFDFHGESHEVEDYEESYSMGDGDRENGAFSAPFEGIHGWFWANHGSEAVTVKLTTTGFYTQALEFRDGFVKKKTLGQ
ncbi:hypothetical protein A9Q89_05145 [Gammaproteobacteria bacterium 53_120_T64]|nr:hypothetical protein A9Q89_05145 [Gammaproteobacteria bacterium 53_120_T64]